MEKETLKKYKVGIDFYFETTDKDEALGIADTIAFDVEKIEYMDSYGNVIEPSAKVSKPREEKETSAEKIVILDFRSGKVFIEAVPQDMIELDADEIIASMEERLQIHADDCQYMVVNDADFLQDNTK